MSRYPDKHAMPDVLAWDHYLKLGDLKGESAEKGQTIEVLSWSWGMSQSGSAGPTKGGGAGKVLAPTATPAASAVTPRDAAGGMVSGKRTAVAAGDLDGDGRIQVAATEPQLDAANEVQHRMQAAVVTACSAQDGVRTMKVRGHVTLLK